MSDIARGNFTPEFNAHALDAFNRQAVDQLVSGDHYDLVPYATPAQWARCEGEPQQVDGVVVHEVAMHDEDVRVASFVVPPVGMDAREYEEACLALNLQFVPGPPFAVSHEAFAGAVRKRTLVIAAMARFVVNGNRGLVYDALFVPRSFLELPLVHPDYPSRDYADDTAAALFDYFSRAHLGYED